jgi:hypothetical protein
MDEDVDAPWWHFPLKVLGILLGLLALSAVSMGLIIGVARYLDKGGARTTAAPSASYYSTPEPLPPSQQNARTRAPQPYGLQDWPDTPSRRTGTGAPGGGARNRGGGSGSGGAESPGKAPEPSVPVGISVEQYEAQVAAGKPIFIPNPKGECGLSGQGGENSARSLTECFAARAAR